MTLRRERGGTIGRKQNDTIHEITRTDTKVFRIISCDFVDRICRPISISLLFALHFNIGHIFGIQTL